MKRLAMSLLMLVLVLQTTIASPSIGHVIYLSGDPDGVRGGRRLWLGIGLGMPLRPFDYFTTAADELIEIETSDEVGVRAMIRIQPDSALYLDLLPGVTARTHRLVLLSGAVSVMMRDSEPRSRLEVVTAGSRIGAAGADYDVALASAGDALITVSRGTARVVDPRGVVLFADTERAVEYRPDGAFRSVPFNAARSDRFRSIWRDQAHARFVADALDVYRRYVDRYLDQLPRFQAAYARLHARRVILDRWMEADRQGRDPRANPEVAAAERRELGEEMLALRETLEPLEATWHRLDELTLFAASGVGPVDAVVGERLTVKEFFDRLAAESRVLQEQMHIARYALRLFAERDPDTAAITLE